MIHPTISQLDFIFPVTNPANGGVVGSVPDMDANDASKAIEAAYEAFKTWRSVSPKVRHITSFSVL